MWLAASHLVSLAVPAWPALLLRVAKGIKGMKAYFIMAAVDYQQINDFALSPSIER